jgi:integrase/recombinase XerD
MQVRITQGKGKKDRYSILSVNALSILRVYYKSYLPRDYLFYGYNKNRPISNKAIQHSYRKALKKSGITKDANFHTLRHTFATHLLEQNVNIKVIQMLLGHSSIRTTMIYTHLVNIKITSIDNPFDKL